MVDMARHVEDLPSDPAVIVTNPEEDCPPEAFAAFVADLLAGPEPELDSFAAAQALRELRADANR